MLDKNKIITIRGYAGSYKSSLAIALANSFINKKVCYIDLEGHDSKLFNNNVKIVNDVNNLKIDEVINEYDIIIIDYIELLNKNSEYLMELKKYIDNREKLLILVSCKASNSNNHVTDFYLSLNNITSLMIDVDKK